jgi:hypothetical protein
VENVAARLVGTWTNASLDARTDDGQPFDAFGGNTRGILFFAATRHFAVILIGDFRTKFASGNRLRGTPPEYEGMARGTNAYYGTYTVDEARATIVLHVEGSAFANWDATDQMRTFILRGDELTLASPATAAGGTAIVAWRRAGPK